MKDYNTWKDLVTNRYTDERNFRFLKDFERLTRVHEKVTKSGRKSDVNL